MQKNVKINKKINNDGEEIVHSVQVEFVADNHNENVQNIKTIFYYKVDKASGICVNPDEGALMKIIYMSEKPLDYDYFHKKFVPLDYVMTSLGYDEHWIDNKDELKNDVELLKKVKERLDWFIPISAEEYLIEKHGEFNEKEQL